MECCLVALAFDYPVAHACMVPQGDWKLLVQDKSSTKVDAPAKVFTLTPGPPSRLTLRPKPAASSRIGMAPRAYAFQKCVFRLSTGLITSCHCSWAYDSESIDTIAAGRIPWQPTQRCWATSRLLLTVLCIELPSLFLRFKRFHNHEQADRPEVQKQQLIFAACTQR